MSKVNADILTMARGKAKVLFWLVGFLLGTAYGQLSQQVNPPVGYQPKLVNSVVV